MNLKLQTAGVQLIGIDRGGAQGIISLEFLAELQKYIRDYLLDELIDLALGISSGELLL